MHFSTLDDATLLSLLPKLERHGTGACDTTPGGLWMWRAFFDTRVAQAGDALFAKIRYYDGSERVMFPLADDPASALETLLRDAGTPLCFAAVTPEQLRIILRVCGTRARAHFERNICDYLYEPASLGQLAGRKLAGQRNHRNYFRTHFEGSSEPIDVHNLEEVLAFYDAHFLVADAPTPLAREEQLRARELLENRLGLPLLTMLLRADGDPVALAAGERVGDTLYVHVEKALRECRGAHQEILSRFALAFGEGCAFENREEDDGTPGLREAKLALHPAALLKKYSVTII